MARSLSPLRYPGGKSILSGFLRKVIYDNKVQGGTYVEPFAGGSGAGLDLLAAGDVDRIVINDVDPAVYWFWRSVCNETDRFVDAIRETPLTVEEWRIQREVYRAGIKKGGFALGFSAFFLNRCNRSGIIKNGGPIGGIDQKGEWKIDARFNREDLVSRIEEIGSYGDRVIVLNEDASIFLKRICEFVDLDRVFIYADPPYYVKGAELYMNHFSQDNHALLATTLLSLSEKWVLSYDDVPETRALYAGNEIYSFSLRYSAHQNSAKGREIMVRSNSVKLTDKAKLILDNLKPH